MFYDGLVCTSSGNENNFLIYFLHFSGHTFVKTAMTKKQNVNVFCFIFAIFLMFVKKLKSSAVSFIPFAKKLFKLGMWFNMFS